MTAWRKWVFPILKTLLVAAIAVALVKLAFFPDRADADAAVIQPTGTVSDPVVAVTRGSIANDVLLTGTVNADAAVAVKATGTGVVDEVFAQTGQQVAAGQKLFDIKVEDPVEPVESVGADGMPVTTMPRATHHFEQVLAPTAGVLSALDVIPGQPVATGDVAGRVAPPSFNVTATLSPEQQYRLTSAPTEAVVTIAGGPAPFTCPGLAITTPLSGAGAGEDGGGAASGGVGGEASGTTVRCVVPAEVRVFPGLSAQVKISAGSADDVLVVPITAVEGGAETGVVWLLTPDGEQVEQTVRLGLSDGTQVAGRRGSRRGRHGAAVRARRPGRGRGRGLRPDARWRHALRNPDEMTLVQARGVGRRVELPDGTPLTILSDVDLTITEGDRVSIVGRSGSGKSTLLNLLGLLDAPTEGELRFLGHDVRAVGSGRRDRLRGREIGFVFQQFNLLPGRTALENVQTPLLYSGGREFWHRERIAREMLERVGLGERLATRPERLSGGEQQRVAIARALVRRPRLILADEPTGALDLETGAEVMALIESVAAETGAALVTITHDPAIAARSMRHLRLAAGRLHDTDASATPSDRHAVQAAVPSQAVA